MSNQTNDNSQSKKSPFSKTLRNSIAALVFAGLFLPAASFAAPRATKKAPKAATSTKVTKAKLGKTAAAKPASKRKAKGLKDSLTTKKSVKKTSIETSVNAFAKIALFEKEKNKAEFTQMMHSSMKNVMSTAANRHKDVKQAIKVKGKLTSKQKSVALEVLAGHLASKLTYGLGQKENWAGQHTAHVEILRGLKELYRSPKVITAKELNTFMEKIGGRLDSKLNPIFRSKDVHKARLHQEMLKKAKENKAFKDYGIKRSAPGTSVVARGWNEGKVDVRLRPVAKVFMRMMASEKRGVNASLKDPTKLVKYLAVESAAKAVAKEMNKVISLQRTSNPRVANQGENLSTLNAALTRDSKNQALYPTTYRFKLFSKLMAKETMAKLSPDLGVGALKGYLMTER